MSALFNTYNRFPLAVLKAEGTTVTDIDGKTYLDFGSGIGVNNLGHKHPEVKAGIMAQLDQYWHVSNLYQVPIQEKVAELLTKHSVCDYVFFCNSGAEANEAAIKLARKATGKEKIITFIQSFHGRTFATMSATGQEKIKTGFGSMLHKFEYVPFNDIEAVKSAIDDDTAAVMLEIIQGEGGVIVAEDSFLKELEALCKQKNVLLIVDEIQTGIGRTGTLFGYEHAGLSPDIVTVAKGLGNGIPIGAMMAKKELYEVFGPGSHGSTFGGNPIAMAAAEAVLKIVTDQTFLHEVQEKGRYLEARLRETIDDIPIVTEIRGRGMMYGIVCQQEVAPWVSQMLEAGLLVLNAGPNVIRLLPPLTVTLEEIDQAVNMMFNVMNG